MRLTTAQKLIIVFVIITALVAVAYCEVNDYINLRILTGNRTNESNINEIFNKYVDNTEEETIEIGADEEKALDLAKSTWGEDDDSVYFSIDNQDENYYYVSVNDNETTEVLVWYRVDIKNGEVSEY